VWFGFDTNHYNSEPYTLQEVIEMTKEWADKIEKSLKTVAVQS